jgi:Tfp pilus assembly pilus retraction ATPase PilT
MARAKLSMSEPTSRWFGEMRDEETVHTLDATETSTRIVDFFRPTSSTSVA